MSRIDAGELALIQQPNQSQQNNSTAIQDAPIARGNRYKLFLFLLKKSSKQLFVKEKL